MHSGATLAATVHRLARDMMKVGMIDTATEEEDPRHHGVGGLDLGADQGPPLCGNPPISSRWSVGVLRGMGGVRGHVSGRLGTMAAVEGTGERGRKIPMWLQAMGHVVTAVAVAAAGHVVTAVAVAAAGHVVTAV
eukprot:Opistho-2@46372